MVLCDTYMRWIRVEISKNNGHSEHEYKWISYSPLTFEPCHAQIFKIADFLLTELPLSSALIDFLIFCCVDKNALRRMMMLALDRWMQDFGLLLYLIAAFNFTLFGYWTIIAVLECSIKKLFFWLEFIWSERHMVESNLFHVNETPSPMIEDLVHSMDLNSKLL